MPLESMFVALEISLLLCFFFFLENEIPFLHFLLGNVIFFSLLTGIFFFFFYHDTVCRHAE